MGVGCVRTMLAPRAGLCRGKTHPKGPTGLATTPITYPAYHLPSAVDVADVNHDGREDVVVAHDGWRTVSVYTQNARSATVNLPATNRPWTIEARAVNGARYQAPPASVRVRANGRVRDGLLVEYQFAERSGTTVYDTSAVGTPLDLTLANEQAVSRVPDGSFVHTPTTIASPAAASKVTGALQGANAFTLEAWVRTANLRQDGPAPMLSLASDAQPLNLALVQTDMARSAST